MTPPAPSLDLARPVTRRTMLAAGATAIGALLAGCSAAVNRTPGGSARTLTVGNAEDFAPSTILRDGTDEAFASLIFDTLATLDRSTRARQPSVATAWRWNTDRTALTVDLRSDVRYHTGRLLGPEDVLFSVRAVLDPTTGAQIGGTAAHIEHMSQTGAHQVRFVLGRPIPSFLDLLVMMPLVDRETYGALATGRRVIGTGPFVFENWTPGASVTLRRNPRYWQAGLPHLDRVQVTIFGSEQAIIDALRAEEIDLAYNLTPRDSAMLTAGGFPAVSTAPFFSEYYVGANVKRPPFDDLRVRQAVAYALNRDRIVAQAFAGFGTVSCLPWPTSTPGVDPAQQYHYSYDPQRAKALLRQAGVPSETIPIQAAANPVSEAILDVVQYDLSAVGLHVQAEGVQMTEFQSLQENASFPGLFSAPVAQFDLDIATVLLGNAPFKVGKNTSNVTAPEYTRLADALIYAGSVAEQRAATAAFTTYVLEQAWHLTVGHVPLTSSRSRTVSGVGTTAGLNVDLSRARVGA